MASRQYDREKFPSLLGHAGGPIPGRRDLMTEGPGLISERN